MVLQTDRAHGMVDRMAKVNALRECDPHRPAKSERDTFPCRGRREGVGVRADAIRAATVGRAFKGEW